MTIHVQLNYDFVLSPLQVLIRENLSTDKGTPSLFGKSQLCQLLSTEVGGLC